MKKCLHIALVLLLLLGAGKVWAINDNSPAPPPRVAQETDPNLTLFNQFLGGGNITNEQRVQLVAQTFPATQEGLNKISDFYVWVRDNYQSTDPSIFDGNTSWCNGNPDCQATLNALEQRRQSIGRTLSGGSGIGGLGTAATAEAAAEAKKTRNISCGIDPVCITLKGVMWLFAIIRYFLEFFLDLANGLFNWTLSLSVRDFNKLTDSDGLRIAWRALRDLVNLSLIFVLLYVAIGTILQLNGVKGHHILKNVIIAGLLVNFSFFFTGLAIDASNVVANSIYGLIISSTPGGTVASKWSGAPDISTQLLQHEGVEKTTDQLVRQWEKQVTGKGETPTYTILFTQIGGELGQILLAITTTAILVAGAILFLIRSIVLLILLTTSPVYFLALAAGGDLVKKQAARWYSTLINQLIFAPAYLVFIFMTVQITKSGFTNLLSGTQGLLGGIISFAIVNGLMLGSLMTAKSLGVAGADFASKWSGADWAKKLPGAVGGGVAAGAYGLAVKPIGQKALRGADSVAKTLQESNSFLAKAGRYVPGLNSLAVATRKVAKSSQEATKNEVEALKLGKKGLANRLGMFTTSAAEKQAIAGILVDKNKGNAEAQAKYIQELQGGARSAAYEGLSARDKAAVEAYLPEAMRKDLRKDLTLEQQDKVEEEEKKLKEKKTQEANFEKLETLLKNSATASASEIEDLLKTVSNKQMENMDFEDIKKIAEKLNGGQMKAVNERKDLTPDQKKAIKEAQFAPIKTNAIAAVSDPTKRAYVEKRMREMSGEDIADLGKDILSLPEVIRTLTPKKLAKLMDKIDDETATIIREAIENEFTKPNGNPSNAMKAAANWLHTDPVGRNF